jgi:hypothetical protein
MLSEGLAMIDDGAEGERLYWFPCVSSFSFNEE